LEGGSGEEKKVVNFLKQKTGDTINCRPGDTNLSDATECIPSVQNIGTLSHIGQRQKSFELVFGLLTLRSVVPVLSY